MRLEAQLHTFQTAVPTSVTDIFMPYILKYCKENILLVLSGVKSVPEWLFSRYINFLPVVFVRVCNLVCHADGGTQIECV